ncbi:MAG: putative phage abortive infection protein [Raineya sp.]|jgi:hypothetical protein|nr:putative phage abortive infection protein [Raineya sp.]
MNESGDSLEGRKFEKDFMVFGAIISILIGIIVLIYFINEVSKFYSMPTKDKPLDLSRSGAFGDYIGGVVGTFFSLAGFFLLYLTLKAQRDNFHKERLESKYFEMIKFHRENVNEIEYVFYNNNKDKFNIRKRKVFKTVFTQFKDAWRELNHLFLNKPDEHIYQKSYLQKLKKNPTLKKRNINLKNLAQIDITYLIIFFGLNKEDKQTIKTLCVNRYNHDFIDKILDFASLKPVGESDYWNKWVMINGLDDRTKIFDDILNFRKNPNSEKKLNPFWIQNGNLYHNIDPHYPDNYKKYYGGHQFRLGHYYRHIFQTVKFIDKEIYLSDKEKYDYIKILRGQLSNYEQIVFFLNSLSEIGRAWEMMNKSNPEDEIKKDKQLITKYNFIKNIPIRYLVDEIDVFEYYPDINFEAITKEKN